MIHESYDLDIVIYWPDNTKYTLKGISNGVGDQIKKYWNNVYEKTVAWNIPFEGKFHIDVVPGRALDSDNYEANLYRRDNGSYGSYSQKITSLPGSKLDDLYKLIIAKNVRISEIDEVTYFTFQVKRSRFLFFNNKIDTIRKELENDWMIIMNSLKYCI